MSPSIVFGIFTEIGSCHHNNFRLFPSPQKKPHVDHQSFRIPHPHLDSGPWKPLIYFLFLCICQFWAFYINGILWYVAFCGFFHLARYFTYLHCSMRRYIIPFYCQIVFCCVDMHVMFIHKSTDGHSGCFHSSQMNTCVHVFVWTYVSNAWG